MSHSLHSLRRAVFGVSCAVVFGFGVSEAVGSPQSAARACPATGYDYPYSPCALGCDVGRGYCDSYGRCQCGDLP